MVQTLEELLRSPNVYEHFTTEHLLVVLGCLHRSYCFARRFNEEDELRTALYKMGFMKQLPNLLKQETIAVSCYLTNCTRLYLDDGRQPYHAQVEGQLVP